MDCMLRRTMLRNRRSKLPLRIPFRNNLSDTLQYKYQEFINLSSRSQEDSLFLLSIENFILYM